MPLPPSPGSGGTPAPVVSSDGVLTATRRDDLGGVLLLVKPSSGQLPVTVPAVTVLRTSGSVLVTVRGMDAVLTPNGLLLGLDVDAPLGVPATYYAVLTGGAGFTSTMVTVTPPRPGGRQWLKHPTDPSLSMLLRIDKQPEWKSVRPTNVLPVVDRRNPITTFGVRGQATAAFSALLTNTTDQDRFEALLDGGGPYLLQADASQPNRRDRWVTISEDTFEQPGVGPEFRSVPVDLTEVDRPSTAGSSVSIPGHRYMDLVGTWASLSGTYLDL